MIRSKRQHLISAFAGLAIAAMLVGCKDDETSSATDVGADAGADATGDTGVAPDVTGDTVSDDTGTADAGIPPEIAACRSAIETLEAAVSGELAGWPVDDASEMVASGGSQAREADYAGRYRDDLGTHPGCVPATAYDANSEFLVSDNEATVPAGSPAAITGYPCAAKEYDQPNENTDLPIVILVHGNSSGVTSFEEYENSALAGTEIANVAGFTFTVASELQSSLATQLLAAGYRVISFDARVDLVGTLEDFNSDSATGNAFHNIDHGWAVPMLQSLIRAVMTENPDRMVSVVSHSLGTTVVRDAVRRLWIEWRDGDAGAVNPFAQLHDMVLLSGANHGVASGQLICDSFSTPPQMRGTVTCEMGDRDAFVPTYFTRRINGPSDLFVTPCADGDFAFGQRGQCEGNAVHYTTVTMEDLPGGDLQDEFVSEASSQLDLEPCVENLLIGLEDFDRSGYFFTGLPGFFANHFGTPRSEAGIQIILDQLAD